VVEAKQLYYLSKRIVTATTRCAVDHFDIHLILPDFSQINLSIPFKHIIQSLLVKPILLSSFLLEVILNRFSYNTIQWVLNHVDLHLPGEDQGGIDHDRNGDSCAEIGIAGDERMMQKALHARTAHTLPPLYPEISTLESRDPHRPKGGFWRHSLWSEITVATYAYTAERALRGPLNTFHSFVSGQYCSVRIDTTAIGDINLTLAPPTNGKFELYAMQSNGEGVLELFITREELLVFIAKSCMKKSSLLSPCFLDNIDILAPLYEEDLHRFLLSSIVIHNSPVAPSAEIVNDIDSQLFYSEQEEVNFKKNGYDIDTYNVIVPSMKLLEGKGMLCGHMHEKIL
jgi:hypothetical protein